MLFIVRTLVQKLLRFLFSDVCGLRYLFKGLKVQFSTLKRLYLTSKVDGRSRLLFRLIVLKLLLEFVIGVGLVWSIWFFIHIRSKLANLFIDHIDEKSDDEYASDNDQHTLNYAPINTIFGLIH